MSQNALGKRPNTKWKLQVGRVQSSGVIAKNRSKLNLVDIHPDSHDFKYIVINLQSENQFEPLKHNLVRLYVISIDKKCHLQIEDE